MAKWIAIDLRSANEWKSTATAAPSAAPAAGTKKARSTSQPAAGLASAR